MREAAAAPAAVAVAGGVRMLALHQRMQEAAAPAAVAREVLMLAQRERVWGAAAAAAVHGGVGAGGAADLVQLMGGEVGGEAVC